MFWESKHSYDHNLFFTFIKHNLLIENIFNVLVKLLFLHDLLIQFWVYLSSIFKFVILSYFFSCLKIFIDYVLNFSCCNKYIFKYKNLSVFGYMTMLGDLDFCIRSQVSLWKILRNLKFPENIYRLPAVK